MKITLADGSSVSLTPAQVAALRAAARNAMRYEAPTSYRAPSERTRGIYRINDGTRRKLATEPGRQLCTLRLIDVPGGGDDSGRVVMTAEGWRVLNSINSGMWSVRVGGGRTGYLHCVLKTETDAQRLAAWMSAQWEHLGEETYTACLIPADTEPHPGHEAWLTAAGIA